MERKPPVAWWDLPVRIPRRPWAGASPSLEGPADADFRGESPVLEEVERWLSARSSKASDWPLERLLAVKRATGARISVVLPALDEEETVGAIVTAVREDLVEAAPLVD